MWACDHKFKKRNVKIGAEIRHFKSIRTDNTRRRKIVKGRKDTLGNTSWKPRYFFVMLN